MTNDKKRFILEETLKKDNIELEEIDLVLSELIKNNDVKEYIRLIRDSKFVEGYINYLNKQRNKKAIIANEEQQLKKIIEDSCSHRILLANMEKNYNNINDYCICTCLECRKKILLKNITDCQIYVTEDLKNEDLIAIRNDFYRNYTNEEDRLVILDFTKREKVKSNSK